MSKHFIDRVNSMSRHAFDQAIITNSKGEPCGKIIVRYTDSQIGWNNETSIILNGYPLDFGVTKRGSTYDHGSVFHLLRGVGAKVYGWNGTRYIGYEDKKPKTPYHMSDSTSNCRDFTSFKIGNKKFNILWV